MSELEVLEKNNSSEDKKANETRSADQLNSQESGLDKQRNLYTSTSSNRSRKFGSKKGWFIGGGIIGGGGLVTIVIFSFLSGPLQFLQLAQEMRKIHSDAQSIQQDERFAREIRYFSKNQVEKTRLSFMGNKFADYFERKLNGSGLKSAYSKTFGLFDGYVIDKTNPRFKGMSDAQIKDYVKGNYGVELKTIPNTDTLLIDGRTLSAADNYKLTYQLMKEAGFSKISSAIGSRMMCLRAGCSFNPLTKIVNNKKANLEEWRKNDEKVLKEGQANVSASDKPNSETQKKQTATQTSDQNNFQNSLGETSSSASQVQSGNQSFDSFNESVSNKFSAGKLAGGFSALLAILCVLDSINKNIDDIKHTQVVQPLIRMGIHAQAIGSQIQSGHNVNLDELKILSKQLNGKDSTGKITSWNASQSIQTNRGNLNTGEAPNSTLKSIGGNTNPFSFLDSIGTLIGAACNSVVQTAVMIFTFVSDFTGIGGLFNAAVGVITAAATGPVINTVSHWLAGSPVDVSAVGADFGNAVDYGSALAANQQYSMAGGTPLT